MEKYNGLEIAIVGISGRFPGAKNVDEFWHNLKNGVESIRHFTDEELKDSGETEALRRDPFYVKANSYLEGKAYFDSAFFNYTPDEAKLMDPQMRIFHECVWEAIENAGLNLEKNQNRIGLFAGGSNNFNWEAYAELINRDGRVDNFSASQLKNVRFMPTKIAYQMNFKGPSVFLDTACSTSLVAIHHACKSLLLEECNIAVSGAVAIVNRSIKGYLYKEGMINSPDGHCRPFDADANGTVGGEGAGVVVLKRLKNALADRDNILAVIKGTGINNDGKNKVGYTAPGVDGQAEAIIKAQKWAKVPVESISYVEAHGTATRLGDPVEIEALTRAFGKSNHKYCAIGSVKSNIGHLDVAAGVTGVIKTILALQHRQLPPSLHFHTPNPKINFDESPFYVNTTLSDWSNDKYPLRAGVSSFGIGGTNAHLILEEAPAPIASSDSRPDQLLLFSAKTSTALNKNIRQFRTFIQENPGVKLADAAFTLQTGRMPFPHRKFIVCKDREEAISLLDLASDSNASILPDHSKPIVVFMFSGQGSQYENMFYDLYHAEETFRNAANKCLTIIDQCSGKDLKHLLFEPGNPDSKEILYETEYAQPALFIVEFALAHLLMSWGLKPDIMIGHSIGEYIAACLSGALSLEDALLLVVKRGELSQKMAKGSMLGITISQEVLKPYLAKFQLVSLAAVNSPEQCTVSGTDEAITHFKSIIEAEGYTTIMLKTSHAFHSYMMDGILDEFKKEVKNVKFNPIQIPFISNVTGRQAKDKEIADPEYWVKHLRQHVAFADGIATLMQNKQVMFLEVGPGKVLSSLVRSNKPGKGHVVISLSRHAKEAGSDFHYLLSGLGKIWSKGLVPQWDIFYQQEKRQKISLPTYSFDQVMYPADVNAYEMITDMIANDSNVSGRNLYAPAWKTMLLKPEAEMRNIGKQTLIFADAIGVSDRLREIYIKNDGRLITVKKGQSFKKLSSVAYELNPEEETDYDLLTEDLGKNGGLPHKIVHAWGLSDDINLSLGISFYSLVQLAKSLHKAGQMLDNEFVLMTNDLFSIIGDEKTLPLKSLSTALIKVMAQEYPGVSTSHLDISLSEGMAGVDPIKMFETIGTMVPGSVIALRKKQRWIQVFEPVIPKREAGKSAFKQGGVYLITGGLGKLGCHLADYLLSKFNARVALIGRTALPQKNEWPMILSGRGVAEELKRKISRYISLESKQGKLLYLPCDVSDDIALGNAVKQVETEFGEINGVIHAAGAIDGSSRVAGQLHELSVPDFERQFAPKLSGLENLENLFGHRDLDFCFLTSSLSAILGGLGFAAYAPANAFMDSYVQTRRQDGKLSRWQSINLDGLDFSATSNRTQGLSANELEEVFEEAFSLNHLCQLIVSKSNLQQRLDTWINKKQVVNDSKIETAVIIAGEEQPAIEDGLIKLWKDFFGKSQILPDDDFFEIGGDSLKALTMLGRIQKNFNVELTIGDFFRKSTVRALTEHISLSVKKERLQPFAIAKAPNKDYYRLSSSQLRLYFLHELDSSSLAYNLPRVMRVVGNLDRERLSRAFKKLIKRHESLRTCIVLTAEGTPVQQIAEQVGFELQYFTAGLENDVDPFVKRFIQPFDLGQAPLLRAGLVRISDNEHLLMLDMHHCITDGVSQSILINDFITLYENGTMEAPRLQYKDYAEWQQSKEQQEALSAQRDFWKKQFAEDVNALNLPTDFQRPLIKNHQGGRNAFLLNRELTQGLKAIGENENATLFMTLLAIFNVLLRKLSNQDDIIVGVPIAGRDHPDLESVVGMFVNTLAVRNFVNEELSFSDFLKQVKEKSLLCLEHGAYPYEALVDDLKVSRDAGRNALFDVMFSFENFSAEILEIPGLTLKPYEEARPVAKWDLLLLAKEADDGQLFLELTYATDLFESQTAARFMGYLHRLIEAVATAPDKQLSQVEMLSEDERNTLLFDFNRTIADFPKKQSLSDMFMRQAMLTPDRIALVCNGASLSYADLDRYSDQLAKRLISLNSEKAVVALFFEPTFELMIAILGVLKAGKAFLALDPEQTTERSEIILRDSGCNVLITAKNLQNNLVFTGEKLLLDISLLQGIFIGKVNVPVGENDLAYMIYTSGSTGRPKGVELSHANLVNYICWYQQFTHLTDSDRMILTTSITFDGGFTSIFPILMTGGTLHLVSHELYHSPDDLLSYFAIHGITHLKITPSLFSILLDTAGLTEKSISNFKYIVVGGEPIKPEDIRKALFFAPRTQFINHYGPTETTIGSIAQYIERNSFDKFALQPTIGKPISNTNCYILGKYNELVPIGCVGELCIGGAGVGVGYLGDEKLTAAKFVADPYREGDRMYRTGDLARWLADGRIEFLGRRDNQIKIRGFRIELGEIESRLLGHTMVREAIVTLKEKQGEKYMIGYYTAEKELPQSEIRSFLLASLPDYMVPAYFVWLTKMPLTSSLKIDRKMLPEPVLNNHAPYAAPETDKEKLLCRIWSKVLGIESVSITDNFFAIGGDSIKSIQIRSRLRAAGYDMSVKDTFSYQTIDLLANHIKPLKKLADQSVVEGEIPLTGVQRRFFESQIISKSQYNQSVMLNFKEGISEDQVLSIFTELQNHHDALRMVYRPEEGGFVQYNRGLLHPLSCRVEELADEPEPEATLLSLCDTIQGSIDLEDGPLMKLGLFGLPDGSRLLIVIHHLIVDGVSWRILFEDIQTLFTQLKQGVPFQLPPKTDSFSAWSQKIREYRHTRAYTNAIAYWNSTLSRKVVEIKRAFPEGLNLTGSTDTLRFQLDPGLTSQILGEVHKSFNTNIDDILLAALLMSVNKNYGYGALRIDREGHGREELADGIDVGRTIGWFTSIYPVLLEYSGKELSGLIKSVKETLRRVPNKGIDYLIGKYPPTGSPDIAHHDGARIIYNYLGQFDSDTTGNEFVIANESTGNGIAASEFRNHDFELFGMVSGGCLKINLTYSKNQYRQEDIQALMSAFQESLKTLIGYCVNYGRQELTPSDLTYKGLSISQLEELQKKLIKL